MKIETFLASEPLLIDLETDSLRADFGLVFCAVLRPYKIRGRPAKNEIFQIDLRPRDMEKSERAMLVKLRHRIEGHGLIAFYGHRFDLPFMQTRFIMQGIRPLSKVLMLDPYFTSKRIFNPGHVVTSGRMAAIAGLLKSGDRSTPGKSGVDAATWRRVKFVRDPKALGAVVRHCIADLAVMEHQVRRWAEAGLLPDRVARR